MLALCFQVGPTHMAVDVRSVREVVPRVRLTSAAGGRPEVAGNFVYRGRIIPVIDLFHQQGAGECPALLSSRIILFAHPDDPERLVGLLATQVADIRDLPPPHLASDTNDPTAAIADGSDILHWIEPNRFFGAISRPALPVTGVGP